MVDDEKVGLVFGCGRGRGNWVLSGGGSSFFSWELMV